MQLASALLLRWSTHEAAAVYDQAARFPQGSTTTGWELDAGMAEDPAQAHVRRGGHWTFGALAFTAACARSGRRAAAMQPAAVAGSGGEPENGGQAAIAVPSPAHGVGDPVPDHILVAEWRRVLLVEGQPPAAG